MGFNVEARSYIIFSTDAQDLASGAQLRTKGRSRVELGTADGNLTSNLVTFPSPNATEIVKPIIKTLSSDGPKENLAKFSSFRTRCKCYSLFQ